MNGNYEYILILNAANNKSITFIATTRSRRRGIVMVTEFFSNNVHIFIHELIYIVNYQY